MSPREAPLASHHGRATLDDGAWLAFEIRPRPSCVPVLHVAPLAGPATLAGRFLAAIARRRTVVHFDHRGSGGSSRSPGRGGTRARARELVTLLDTLGLAVVDVVGVSYGGLLASWLAIDAPRRVRRLVLVATPADGSQLAAHAHRALARFGPCLLHRDGRLERCLVERVLSTRFRTSHQTLVAEVFRRQTAPPTSRRILLARLRAAALHHPGDRLRLIRSPTLVLAARRDPIVLPRFARALAESIPQAHFISLPGAAHDVTLEQPSCAAGRVLAFLDDR